MWVHQPSRSLLLRAEDPLALRALIPMSRTLAHADYNLAIKHTLDATKVLRNIGLPDVPSPIMSYYNWPGGLTPFDHQYAMAEFMTMHKRFFNLSEMGTAKTNGTLWGIDWLMREGRVRRCLISCPNQCTKLIWEKWINLTLMHRTCTVLTGSKAKRLEKIDEDHDFYIINHEGMCIADVRKALQAREDIDMLIVDDITLRNVNTDRWRAFDAYMRSKPEERVGWLSGTPCPNAPSDVWAACKLVVPNNVPKFFGAFRRATMTEVNSEHHIWRPRPDGYKVAYDAMQPAIRFEKSKCLTLPPVTFIDWECELTSEQKTAFKDMKNNSLMEDKRDEANGKPITAGNAVDRLLKLRQILCGCVKAPDGSYTTLDHAPRAKLVLDAIGQASAKVIIVVPFKGIIYSLNDYLSKHTTVGLINGDVSLTKRTKIIEAFKDGADPHVLLCHPQVMSHGLDLTEADYLVIYAPFHSNDQYRQVLERFNRPGQVRKMTVVRISGHKLERAIYDNVDQNEMEQHNVLSLYRDIVYSKGREL